jgi:hypothetical protein
LSTMRFYDLCVFLPSCGGRGPLATAAQHAQI